MLDLMNLQGEYRFGRDMGGGNFLTPVGRLSFSHFFQKSAPPQSPDSKTFNCELIFNTGNPAEPCFVELGPLRQYVDAMVAQFFAEKQKQPPYGFETRINNGLKRATTDGYGQGTEFISPKSYDEIPNILVIDQNRMPLGPGQFKDGDFFRLKINPYVSPNYSNGVSFGLRVAQLIHAWQPFSAAAVPETGDDMGTVETSGQAPEPQGMPAYGQAPPAQPYNPYGGQPGNYGQGGQNNGTGGLGW